MTDPPTSADADAAPDPDTDPEGTARAEAEILRELLGVAAHDLSNPLQSLSVLLELAADEAEAGEPVGDKLEHALTAAEQLRELIRGLAEFSRGIPTAPSRRTAGRALDQALGVCHRRFERQRIALVRETEAADGLAPVDPQLPTVLLGALLAGIHTAGRSGMAEHRLEIAASAMSDGAATLTLSLTGEGDAPLPLAPRELDRIARAVHGRGGLVYERLGPGRIAFRLTADAAADPGAHG